MPIKQPRKSSKSAKLPEAGNPDYRRLIAFLQLASGFSLAIARCNLPSLRQEIIERAAQEASESGTRVETISLPPEPTIDFVGALRQSVGTIPGDEKTAIMITGIDALIYKSSSTENLRHDQRPKFVAQLNFDRERLAHDLPFPMVLWVESEALRVLLREAPDLTQWISAHFEFGSQSIGVGINGGQVVTSGDVVGRDKITSPIAPVRALYQLPSPPADFTGRTAELAELLQAVKKNGVTISGLQGMGGVGKTALALKLAEQLQQDYPDGQFYLDLKGVSKEALTPKEAMAHVVRAYDFTAQLPESEADVTTLYRSVLHNKKVLLLLDDARDAQQVEPLLPPAGCLLLVTSRRRFTLPGLVEKNLDALPPGDAHALLLEIAPRIAHAGTECVANLARLCGYLPLALRAVGSVLKERIDLGPADYARKLEDTSRRRHELSRVDVSLQVSYDLLAAELQKRFRALAVFPDTFDVAAAAALWEAEQDTAEEGLGELLLYSLIAFDAVTTRYHLHDLVRWFAEVRLDATERKALGNSHARHYLNVINTAHRLYQQGGESVIKGLALFDLEWGNIQAAQAWAASHALQDDTAAELCSAYPSTGADLLELRQHPRERIRWLEPALAAARRLKDRGRESAALGNLGVACHSLGEYRRAIEYHEQRLQIAHEIGDRQGGGQSLGNLGVAYHSLGEYRRAIEYHEQDLQIARDIGDRQGEGAALGNLGLAYYSLGEYHRAIEYQEQYLQIARDTGHRQRQGVALGNLGLAYYSLGEYGRAIEHQEQCLQIVREIGDRLGEGRALGNLGLAYDSLGEYRRALEYYQQQLQITREVGDRGGEGNALWNSSLTLDQMGNRAEAIANAEAALRILEQIESPFASRVRDQLAKWRAEEKGHSAETAGGG